MRTTTTRLLTAVTVIPFALALFTACSAGSPSAGGEKTKSSSAGPITDRTEWGLAYAACMRSQGIDMPDPTADGDLTSTIDMEGETYAAASKKCVEKVGEPPAAPGEKRQSKREAFEERLKAAKCFRENGVDMEDPTEDTFPAMPADAPEDVVKKCLGDAAAGATQLGTAE